MSSHDEITSRLERIKELWRQLERVKRTTPRYEELMKEIHSESLAYQALLTAQYDLERRQNDRRQIDRRQINRPKK
jgi:hypothetical protein